MEWNDENENRWNNCSVYLCNIYLYAYGRKNDGFLSGLSTKWKEKKRYKKTNIIYIVLIRYLYTQAKKRGGFIPAFLLFLLYCYAGMTTIKHCNSTSLTKVILHNPSKSSRTWCGIFAIESAEIPAHRPVWQKSMNRQRYRLRGRYDRKKGSCHAPL